MTRDIALPAGTVSLSRSRLGGTSRKCFDYAYLRSRPTARLGHRRTHSSNSTVSHALTASRAAPDGARWEDADGRPVGLRHRGRSSGFGYFTDRLRVRYGTDGRRSRLGFALDNLAITGQPTDGAETDPGWTFDRPRSGLPHHAGTETFSYFNAYIAEYRNYGGYDKALKLGPYNFDDPAGNWVTHFPNQDGLLIWYYDTSRSDNNVGDHPGEGLILPIDAHPAIRHYTSGTTPGAVVRRATPVVRLDVRSRQDGRLHPDRHRHRDARLPVAAGGPNVQRQPQLLHGP